MRSPHVAHIVENFLNASGIATVPYPPYSPDLAPFNFWLFPEVTFSLRRWKFNTNQEIIKLWRCVARSARKMV